MCTDCDATRVGRVLTGEHRIKLKTNNNKTRRNCEIILSEQQPLRIIAKQFMRIEVVAGPSKTKTRETLSSEKTLLQRTKKKETKLVYLARVSHKG